ncbi:putative protein TPRXL isoform X2 [Melanotaenia boesemani]|uniref:putative protein TPRXL isoform X2 n=1 Tax=Melanotaenia boesemani TaxID=1250792 RepID=UPI001C03EB0D|nr:putative protein TPRXL isoform X2 [Melanotaenia boesemani]
MEADQHYTWTAVLLPNPNQPTSPRLVLRRIPVSDHSRGSPPKCYPGILSSSTKSSPANPSPIPNTTSPSSSSSSLSFSCCPSLSSSTSSSSSSHCSPGSSKCSSHSQCHSEQEDECWTCEVVEAQ